MHPNPAFRGAETSRNIAFARLGMELGREPLLATLRSLGFGRLADPAGAPLRFGSLDLEVGYGRPQMHFLDKKEDPGPMDDQDVWALMARMSAQRELWLAWSCEGFRLRLMESSYFVLDTG